MNDLRSSVDRFGSRFTRAELSKRFNKLYNDLVEECPRKVAGKY